MNFPNRVCRLNRGLIFRKGGVYRGTLASRNAVILVVSAAGLAAMPNRAFADSELFSETAQVPSQATFSFDYDAFDIILDGDNDVPPQTVVPATDPFAVLSNSTITTTPGDATGFLAPNDPNATTVEFRGNPILPSNVPNQGDGDPPGFVQIGLTGPADGTELQIIIQAWRDDDFGPGTVLAIEPLVSVTASQQVPASPPEGSSFKYIVDFIQFSQGLEPPKGEWFEFPYLGQPPTFTYAAPAAPPGPASIVVDSVGFFLSDTQIPLDQLNFLDEPAPGMAGSPFTPEPIPTIMEIPEPSTLMILSVSAFGLLGRRIRRGVYD